MRRSERSPHYRSTALDRALASARTVVVVGPTAGLDADSMRAVLRAAQNSTATPRLAMVPRSDHRVWSYCDDLDQSVTTLENTDTGDLGRLVTEIRTDVEPRRALQVLICGDYVVVDYSHGIADGQLGVTLPALLSTGDTSRAESVAHGLKHSAVWSALWKHYRSNPAALKKVWRLRGEHKTGGSHRAERRVQNWQASTRSCSAYLGPEQVRRLRNWAKATWPGATGASITVSLWLAALHAEGLPVDDKVMVLMNCRRYLGPEYATSQGNFAVGVPIRLPGLPSPSTVAGITREVIESGWPVAILAMAEIKARLPGRAQVPGEGVDGGVIGDRIRTAVSDVGRLRMYEQHPWVAGLRPPQLAAYLEPDGPDAVPLLVSELAGGQTFTASFCAETVEHSVIESAFDRMCSDPIGLLEGRTDV
ncbi:hypothetical protein BH11ACT6_BH11ACT6_30060 [soil metagenome]